MTSPPTPRLYTVIFLWGLWNSLFGAIGTAAAGAFGMDILPSDAEGRPLNAARDMQVRKTPGWPRSWANFSLL
jgi:hypothetical protein